MNQKLGVIAFTEHGCRLAAQLTQPLAGRGYDCDVYGPESYAPKYGLTPLTGSARAWAGEMFPRTDALLFVGAAGIAVRSIAPYLKGKEKDPAVVVTDERGMFAVSLLSGHLGGANALAGTLADLTGGIPVITTATDLNGRFAVDLFAKKQNLWMSDLAQAKRISADILDEKPVGLLCEFPVIGQIPEELTPVRDKPFAGESGIVIALNRERTPFAHTLHLIPRLVCLGIGCRQGISEEAVSDAVSQALRLCHISGHGVCAAASIDRKKEEQGLLDYCRKRDIPFRTYTAQELRSVKGTFSASPFVEEKTGVDCVCERSALCAAGCGSLVLKKQVKNGVTVAVAVREWRVDFG